MEEKNCLKTNHRLRNKQMLRKDEAYAGIDKTPGGGALSGGA